jgi:tetratricopeptide (TPR) repeat protein
MGEKHRRPNGHLNVFIACIILAPLLLCGCGHLMDEYRATSTFGEANDFFRQGSYEDSLDTYQKILENYPAVGDRVLFEMGIIYAYAGNGQKDYGKALECFRKLVQDYPGSGYRKESEVMIFSITNVTIKDRTIAAQQAQIETLRQEIDNKESALNALQTKIKVLEQVVRTKGSEIVRLQTEAFILRKGTADRILIEKNARLLTLFSKDTVLKTYKIALGGNPTGPKERQGDNKTPEGMYVIDSKNKDSRYHRSLHISYPNEKDKKRAKQLGVSPGGDIMIHGIKNGLSWAGDLHRGIDWTKGCIAVTDEEIEEIDALAPKGTIVEIRP